jgi:chromosome segregation ATPase
MRLKRPRQTEAIVQQPSMLQYDGEARARLEDFSRFFGSVAAEAQETKAQLLDSKDKLTTLLNRVSEQDGVIQEQEARLNEQDKKFRQITEYVAKCKGKVIEKGEAINALEQRVQTFQRLVADQQKEIKDQKSQVVKLEQIRDMGRTKQMEFQSERNALEDRLKTQSDFVHAAQEQFTDCITLDQNANCILLTSGQHTNLEGIIKIWMHNENFNGDVWFPFQCPVTKTTTMPVRDLCELFIFYRNEAG